MTIITLSSTTTEILSNLISTKSTSQSSSSANLDSVLPKPLLDQLTLALSPKLSLDSPAIPSTEIESDRKECRVDTKLLTEVASWARAGGKGEQFDQLDLSALSLNSLLKNAKLYHVPKPVRVRSPELKAQLSAIRLEQERLQYEQMLIPRFPTSNNSTSPFSLKSLTSPNVSNPGTGRYNGALNVGGALPDHLKLTPEQEMKEWNEVKKQLSAIVNVLLSMGATATAAWWALGNVSIASKTVTSLLVAFLIGIAEVVLYSRHWNNLQERNQNPPKSKKGRIEASRFNFPDSMNGNVEIENEAQVMGNVKESSETGQVAGSEKGIQLKF